jgi:hypothetical protein
MTRMVSIAAALAILVISCGGGSGGSTTGPTGVDRSKPVSSVTEDEKGALCDWFAPMVAGYGNPHPCGDAVLTAPTDKAMCIADFPSCAVTVGQFQDCVVAIVAAQDACTQQALLAAQMRADCQAAGLANCFQ